MISRATENDLPEILRLQRLAFHEEAEHVRDPNIKPLSQTLEGLQADLAAGPVLKYVLGDEIVGSIRAQVVGDTCYIGRLVVHPDHWRQGIGRELMREIEHLFENAERFELFTRVDHQRTRPFYASQGYAPYRTERYSDTLSFVYLQKMNVRHRAPICEQQQIDRSG